MNIVLGDSIIAIFYSHRSMEGHRSSKPIIGVRISMGVLIMDDILIINNKEQLERYLKKYNCKTEEELDEVLWYEYGVTLKNNIKLHKL